MATILPEMFNLEILKMSDGGYIVGDGHNLSGDYRSMRFASTSIDEALRYIKSKMEPIAANTTAQ